MGSAASKVRCLFLPAQSGKTRKVEEEITELKRLCGISGSRSIDIFISANNRLLVHQTTARMRRDLGTDAVADDGDEDDTDADTLSSVSDASDDAASDAVIKGKMFSWTHGKTTGISPESLADKFLLEEVEMVFMCANKRRFTYLAAMLDRLTKHRLFRRDPAQIYIWIDEADSSMSIWRQFEAAAMANPAITQITLISATFGRVLKKYARLRIVPYEHTHPDCYRRLINCQRVIVRNGLRDPCQFVLSVLSEHAEIMANGTRCFIPGAYTKDSHYEIANALQILGFAVVVINGECKELRIPGEPTIDLREYLSCPDPEMLPDEFNQTLAELYARHRLWRFPFAITGYLCIQRGVTFQCASVPGRHDGFVFTHGIIPSIRDKAEAYQTMARMFGNTGTFPNYVCPVIYADEKTFTGVHDQEETAVNLPRMVFTEGLENVGAEDFARAAEEYGVSISSRTSNRVSEYGLEEFFSMDDLNERWDELYREKKGVKPPRRLRSPNQKVDRYVCSIGGDSKEQTVDAIRKFAIGTRSWGSGITTASPGDLISRVLVGYDGSTPIFFLRWAIKLLTHSAPDAISHV